ncbi:hypothetical protein SRB5_30330 [Streptomyces sp. RB5]|uniref:Thioredoxin domain-containing protein n=1 Tax=Streptomyces smaragdinus TaxID=2585196 RepID=A0A7K0CJF0_9ACTN|nr:redoxin family protein [Streptomyces smaragdinus]MQY12894.1 hypothetical protein [Streptomyces smaragdinus]
MIYLTAGLVLVGAVTVLNLLLTLAVIRRLRRQESHQRPEMTSGPAVGSRLPAFTAVSVGGDEVSDVRLAGRSAALTFLSTGCPACDAAVNDLPEFAERTGMDAEQLVVVIAADDEAQAAEMAGRLTGLATVVVEGPVGGISTRYGVSATPTTVLAGADGLVTYAQAGTNPVLDRLPV